MMSFVRTPRSIASRVRSGRPSMARRRSSIGERRRRMASGRMPSMRLGVHIGYWGLGLSSADQLEIVQEAERLGYDSVWAAEAYGSDAATILGWLAHATSKIRLGSAIFQMPGRSAAMTAMAGATLDQLSGGGVILGIGSRRPQGGGGGAGP